MAPKRKSNFRRHQSLDAGRMRRRRRNETAARKELRLTKDRDYHRGNRLLETPEQRLQRLTRDRDYHRGSRKHESPEQRLRRLTKDRESHRESRLRETPEQRAQRLAQHRNYQRVVRMNERLRYQLYNMEFRNILYAMNQPLMDRKLKQTTLPSDYVSDMGGSEGAPIDWKYKIPHVAGYPAYEDKDLLYPGDIDPMGFPHTSHETLDSMSMKEEPFDGTPKELNSDSRPLDDVIVKVEVDTEFEENSTSQVKDFNRKLKVDPEHTGSQMDDGNYPMESKHFEENVPHTSQEALDIIYVKEEPIDDYPQELSGDVWSLEERQFECKNAFPCSKCSRLFYTENSLNLHMSECFHQAIINYSNGPCTNKRKRSATRKRKKVLPDKRPYKCSVCGKEFAYMSSFKMHQRIHTGERPYKCTVCNLAVSTTSSLNAHQRIHTGEKPYKCPVCGKAFAQLSYVKVHLNLHTGEKPHECSVCGRAFAYLSSFKTHQRIHTGERPYKCSVCGFAVSTISSLNAHQRTHTGERPYKCPICGKSFAQLSYVKVHQNMHTGEKPHECSVCGKAFAYLSSFKTHQRIHTGERPYRCPVCSKDFITLSALKRHQKTTEYESL
uniref:C2H2-type domain-containing protein n=1 Tax=Eptatretus burgeri TaxID=7764 RepID=A0A8C4PX77_EPTBU